MRTNIVLDGELVEEAMRYSKSKTRRGLVEEALRTFVRVKEDEQRLRSYRERLTRLRSRLSASPLRDSARDLVRRDRDRA
ncbi:MAG TPA: type II toxin-antitoxin system VapB family antitoxin [Thermoanaerobaculia bacterium]|nr:type II toxin-antitoxin system VapB family antitoxin [Thermoanaerobaculia bacterium]